MNAEFDRLSHIIGKHLEDFGKPVICRVDDNGAEFKLTNYINMAAGTSRLINQLARITNYRRVETMAVDEYTFHIKLVKDEA